MDEEVTLPVISITSLRHVSRIELGKNYSTIDRLEKMTVALNVSLVNFFEFIAFG